MVAQLSHGETSLQRRLASLSEPKKQTTSRAHWWKRDVATLLIKWEREKVDLAGVGQTIPWVCKNQTARVQADKWILLNKPSVRYTAGRKRGKMRNILFCSQEHASSEEVDCNTLFLFLFKFNQCWTRTPLWWLYLGSKALTWEESACWSHRTPRHSRTETHLSNTYIKIKEKQLKYFLHEMKKSKAARDAWTQHLC